MITTIIIFLLVLGLLIFVHEFGHFITAKRSGISVEEFGFGFPPRIFGIKRKGTIYSLNWVPLGGFVKIKGESGEHKRERDSFAAAPAYIRAVVIAAGVSMNLVLAWILLSVGFVFGVPQSLDDLPSYATVRERTIRIVAVLPNSPAEAAGVRLGDAVLSLDGQDATSLPDVRSYIAERVKRPINLKLRRGTVISEVTATPTVLAETGRAGLGVGLVDVGLVSYPWYIAPAQGALATVSLTKNIVLAFVDLFLDLALGRGVDVDFSGPVGIAVITGEVARQGLAHLLQFTALLSVNLAVINVLPVPALDGGRLLFLFIEAVRRKPVSMRIEAMIHRVGFALLITLVILVTYRDLSRFGGRILKALRNLVGV